jgi:hypothetical protein
VHDETVNRLQWLKTRPADGRWYCVLDQYLVKTGELMSALHKRLRINYGVSCAALDLRVKLSQSCPGPYGARMTGGWYSQAALTTNFQLLYSTNDFPALFPDAFVEERRVGATQISCCPIALPFAREPRAGFWGRACGLSKLFIRGYSSLKRSGHLQSCCRRSATFLINGTAIAKASDLGEFCARVRRNFYALFGVPFLTA